MYQTVFGAFLCGLAIYRGWDKISKRQGAELSEEQQSRPGFQMKNYSPLLSLHPSWVVTCSTLIKLVNVDCKHFTKTQSYALAGGTLEKTEEMFNLELPD